MTNLRRLRLFLYGFLGSQLYVSVAVWFMSHPHRWVWL